TKSPRPRRSIESIQEVEIARSYFSVLPARPGLGSGQAGASCFTSIVTPLHANAELILTPRSPSAWRSTAAAGRKLRYRDSDTLGAGRLREVQDMDHVAHHRARVALEDHDLVGGLV